MAGLDAGPDALDGEGGLLLALSPNRRADVTTPAGGLGRDWGILAERLNIKRYPTVGASQRIADCAIALHGTALAPAGIGRVRAHVSEKHARVMPIHRPRTALEAKFSLEFVVASGLIAGAVGFAQLDDAFVQRDDVQALMARVETVAGPDDDPDYPSGARADIIHVDLKDGRAVSSPEVTRWRGHALNPMTDDELKAKFLDCTAGHLDAATAGRWFAAYRNIADVPSVAALPTLPG
jgi:2-methylcitrate dehydratase PrpD